LLNYQTLVAGGAEREKELGGPRAFLTKKEMGGGQQVRRDGAAIAQKYKTGKKGS